ncbi:transporter substrate-binding domain-containing protein [Labrys monachus]|uniref:Polar amino acid transport system substrate-binding protein n=1 Tax=Labrys monachus TaxID=217067 RepID=A0ABU0FIJ4_9HYPH|nr:transporter substrate-binding domain-containing protein [Labrys monachus]MDQ0394429.1 polar amino acid transport system substrate-binding protein [Labrys monachus]
MIGRLLASLTLGLAAGLLLSQLPVKAAELPTVEAFGKTPECAALRTKYPALTGKKLTIGLGGYTVGFEAPSAADPTVIEGLDPDLINYMSACLGFTYEFQNGSFNVLLTSITSGRADMGPSLYVTDVRRKQVAFISNFAVIDGSVVRKGEAHKMTSLDSLCGATVAAAAGTYEAVNLVPPQSEKCKAAGKPEVNLLLVQNTDNSVQAVQSGRADIYLTALSDANALAKSASGLENAFSIDLPILNGFPIAKENTLMRGAVLDAMKAIQAQGIEKVLLAKWGQGAESERPAEDKE